MKKIIMIMIVLVMGFAHQSLAGDKIKTVPVEFGQNSILLSNNEVYPLPDSFLVIEKWVQDINVPEIWYYGSYDHTDKGMVFKYNKIKHVPILPPANKRKFVYDVNQPGRWYLGEYAQDGKSFLYSHTGLNPLADFSTVGHTNRYYYKGLPSVPVRRVYP